jgi:hypothetical protein
MSIHVHKNIKCCVFVCVSIVTLYVQNSGSDFLLFLKLQLVVCYLQWVFWVGPFLGAALAAAYQMLVIRAMPFRAKQLAEET